ncbi:MAG TPA: ABC transporter ATP-binding protein [Candidatus Diapherotrites archaeon]|jgi:ABC-2 type transport system ATP-binding protein|nr:ABC transporter ATP-binding protein [Candidatus Diapherotrites archaeon]
MIKQNKNIAIEVKNLSKSFKSKLVLDNISFNVQQGSITGFFGPNGAGKTTTMRIILGLLYPNSGCAKVFGEDVDKSSDIRNRIGVLLEQNGMSDRLSAYDNLDYYATIYNIKDKQEKINSLLKQMGLFERKNEKIGTFSTGMKKKLGLARALLNDPDILFLDEPTVGLDPDAQKEFRNLILDLSKQKKLTVLLNTHNLNEAQKVCTDIIVINNTKIRYSGNLKETLQKYKTRDLEKVYFEVVKNNGLV